MSELKFHQQEFRESTWGVGCGRWEIGGRVEIEEKGGRRGVKSGGDRGFWGRGNGELDEEGKGVPFPLKSRLSAFPLW